MPTSLEVDVVILLVEILNQLLDLRTETKMSSSDILQTNCDSCAEGVQEPYIECCECDINLCTTCFAAGLEVRTHKNDHKYAVRRNDFPLFDNCNWSAKEECKLLSALSTFGYGNWEDIAKTVHSRSKLECQEHYKKYYIENVQFKELDILPETDQSMFPKPLIPYLYSTEICKDPPRNNHSDQHLAGYNAYRSEFELSYDHHAESIFNIEDNYSDDDPDEEEDECMDALKIACASALNTRLKERQRRYKIIQNHGLIMMNKLVSWAQTYEKTLTKQKVERLLTFMQFMSGMQFDAFIESLSLESELMQNINRMSEYRKLGIKTLYGARLFKKMKKEHELIQAEQKYTSTLMTGKFESQLISPLKGRVGPYRRYRKTVMPLDIFDLPGFHLLTETEKTLCSRLRLVPKNYLEIKELLVNENNKLGSLKLLDARKILKIDVNKTRKIYDYLASDGHIKVCK